MFDLGWSELLIVATVSLVVIGPKELPRTLKSLGRGLRQLRRMTSDVRSQISHALDETDFGSLKAEMTETVRSIDPGKDFKRALNTFREPVGDLETELKSSHVGAPPPAALNSSSDTPEGNSR